MNNKLLSQPNLLSLLVASFISSKTKKNKVSLKIPTKIAGYRLSENIKKNSGYNNYTLGIYEDKDMNKYFVKTWHGKYKNLYYYSLVNEYIVGITIHNKIANSASVKIPRVIEFHATSNTFSVIFEYVQGNLLSTYPVKYQAKMIDMVIKTLDEVSLTLTTSEMDKLKHRGLAFYLLTLPIYTLLSMIYLKKNFLTIIGTMFKAYMSVVKLVIKHPIQLALAHRDLSPENIIIKNNEAYLVDLGLVCLTLKDYDYAYLQNQPEYRDFTQYLKLKSNKLLENYIAIQEASGFDNHPERKQLFLQNLIFKYEN